jgi:hypothetical protein
MPIKAEACRILNQIFIKSVLCRFLQSDTGVRGSNVTKAQLSFSLSATLFKVLLNFNLEKVK